MEWRQQSTFSCADAFNEAQRWIEEVTGKPFGCTDFRAALENGVLLCDLINKLKPGIIKKLNRLATPIAGLDNINVFLKACGKLGLNESQLFHPGDLQDLSTRTIARRNESSRRLKNVLITVYWLGRKAYLDDCYNGAQLNFKAFEGLLGLALSKALDEGSNAFGKDGAFQEFRHPPGRTSYKRENSVDSLDSTDSRAAHANGEGCGSDAEAEQVFRMESAQEPPKGLIPPPLPQRKRAEENEKGSTSFSRSKSLTDIPMAHPSHKVSGGNDIVGKGQDTGTGKWHQDRKWRSHSAARDSEVRWQDALAKWKNHRKNSKSNLRRKSLDREHVINKMSNGAVPDLEKKENHHGAQLKREQLSAQRRSAAPRSHSTSPPSNFSSSVLRTHRRAPLVRSYATTVAFSPASSQSSQDFSPAQAHSTEATPTSDGNIMGAGTHFASLAINVITPTEEKAYSFQTQFRVQDISAPLHPGNDVARSEKETGQMSSLAAPVFYNDPDLACAVDALGDLSDRKPSFETERHESPCEMSGDKSGCPSAGSKKYLSRAASWSCSASLPRGFRRFEDSCRLSSVITPRPFGTRQARLSTLPTLYNVSGVNDNRSLMRASEEEDTPSPPANATLKRQTATSYLRVQHHNTVQAVDRVEQTFHTGCNQLHPQQGEATIPPRSASSDFSWVDHRDMRVSLAPKPTSGPDFVFQPAWEATGARLKFIQPGGPAELRQLRADDDLAARTSSRLREEKVESAQQIGTMDLQRFEKRGGSESAISDLQVPSLTPPSSSWSWDHQGDHRRQQKWQEEQERLLQAQYERDQQRLRAEWHEAKSYATEENDVGMCDDGGIHRHGLTKIKEQRPEEIVFEPQNGTRGDLNDRDWAEDTSGFAQLSPAHRAKSLSTPALAGSCKQPKDDLRRRREESVSKAEQERQRILEEMKKRTQLLTDNSWIRQRSGAFYKEPIYIGMPLKRYESLEALGSSRSTLTAGSSRPHSAAAGYSASARSNNGWRSSQRSTAADSHPGSVWAASNILERKTLQYRFGSEIRNHTASPVISNLNHAVPHPCDEAKAD